MAPRILAGIVTFHPDEEALARLVAAVAPDVARVVLVANSAVTKTLERRLAEAAGGTPLEILRQDGNVGIGAAHVLILARAEAEGAAFGLLLDQDSRPPAGTAPRLAAAFRSLVEAGERPALVGPLPVADGGARIRLYARRHARSRPGLRPVSFAIASGSLVSVEAAEAIGPFRGDFFIDAIDVEWGFRAWSRGWSVWIAEGVPMPHRLGRRGGTALGLTDQPPRRIYFFLRNQLAFVGFPHVPLGHKVRFLALLPGRIALYLARERASPAIRRAIARGLADGLAGRLGPPPAGL